MSNLLAKKDKILVKKPFNLMVVVLCVSLI